MCCVNITTNATQPYEDELEFFDSFKNVTNKLASLIKKESKRLFYEINRGYDTNVETVVQKNFGGSLLLSPK